MPAAAARPDADAVRRLMAPLLSHGPDADAVRMHHLDAVLLVCMGLHVPQVAALFDVHPRTVQRWVHAVAAGNGQAHPLPPGRHPRVAGPLRDRLRLLLADAGGEARHWTGKHLRLHLERSAGLSLSLRSCQRLLAQCRPSG